MTDKPLTQEGAQVLLAQRVRESGLTSTDFAHLVLLRDDRTLRRWLAGETPVPNILHDFLLDPQPRPWPKETA